MYIYILLLYEEIGRFNKIRGLFALFFGRVQQGVTEEYVYEYEKFDYIRPYPRFRHVLLSTCMLGITKIN